MKNLDVTLSFFWLPPAGQSQAPRWSMPRRFATLPSKGSMPMWNMSRRIWKM